MGVGRGGGVSKREGRSRWLGRAAGEIGSGAAHTQIRQARAERAALLLGAADDRQQIAADGGGEWWEGAAVQAGAGDGGMPRAE